MLVYTHYDVTDVEVRSSAAERFYFRYTTLGFSIHNETETLTTPKNLDLKRKTLSVKHIKVYLR